MPSWESKLVTSYLAAHQSRLLPKELLLAVSSSVISFFVFFLNVGILTNQQCDLAVKFKHCAVYCLALRSSWNFINSVSFYSLLFQGFTYCLSGMKFVPLVKEFICLTEWAYLRKVRTW